MVCRHSPQPTVSVRLRAPLEQLDDEVKAALERLSRHVGEQRTTPAGPAFIAYRELGADQVDVELGIPVPEHVRGGVDVHLSALPAGRYAVVVQLGAVPALGDIDRALDRWLEQKHERRHGPLYVSAGLCTAADGVPVPCVYVERPIMAGEPRGAASPCWGASLPGEVMGRAASVIRHLSVWSQAESHDRTRPLMVRAREAWLERKGSMRVADVMSQDVHSCSRSQSLQEAAKLMWDHDVGALPVVDNERRPIGVITDRDICMAAYTQGRPLSDIGVASAMSQRVLVCRRHDPVSAAEQTMAGHQVRRLPVVDERGVLVGMLSLNDIVLARTRSPLKSAAERLLGDVVQTLAAISQHRRGGESTSAPPAKRAPKQVSGLSTGGSP